MLIIQAKIKYQIALLLVAVLGFLWYTKAMQTHLAAGKVRCNMKRQTNEVKMNYLYGRLSKDDERFGDSMSIENQRNILTTYAKENGLIPYEFIYDDGYSGTDWDRPAFNRLLAEVEAGNVASCVVKDLSRFGRDYLKVGFYSEILFPKFDVRLVALGDNVDSEQGENDLTPIVNLFNEWFVKSTSQKIRTVWQDKGKRGERLAVIPPYGYRKAEDNPKQLVVDEESAGIVRRIFTMCTEGTGAAEIAKTLMLERHLNPSAYKYEHGIMTKMRPMKDPYLWNATVIHKILDAQEYLGHTVNFKTWSKSYKDNKCRWNPPEKHMVFKNTHPALIDETTWEIVRKMRQTKRRAPRYGEVGLFTGLAYCSDCGAKLYYSTREIWNTARTKARYEGAYSCSEYRKAVQYQDEGRKCTCHYIRENALSDIIVEHMRQVFSFAANYEREFAAMVRKRAKRSRNAILQRKSGYWHRSASVWMNWIPSLNAFTKTM
jgi:DNA invertase Pin-like site-specific DNA recombinase